MQSERQAQTRAEVANHGDGEQRRRDGRQLARGGLLALLLLVPVVDDQLEPITSTAISTFSDANQKTQVVPHLSLCGMSGFSCLSRATSVCMNLLNGVSFFLPPADDALPGHARTGENT